MGDGDKQVRSWWYRCWRRQRTSCSEQKKNHSIAPEEGQPRDRSRSPVSKGMFFSFRPHGRGLSTGHLCGIGWTVSTSLVRNKIHLFETSKSYRRISMCGCLTAYAYLFHGSFCHIPGHPRDGALPSNHLLLQSLGSRPSEETARRVFSSFRRHFLRRWIQPPFECTTEIRYHV